MKKIKFFSKAWKNNVSLQYMSHTWITFYQTNGTNFHRSTLRIAPKKCSMNSSNDKIHAKSQAGNTTGNTYMQQVINVQKNLCHHFHIFCLAQSFNVLMPNINTHMHAHATARNCQFPSVPSAHHSHHPSPPHSFIPGLKLSFSANPSQRTLLFFFRTDSTLSLDCLLIVLSIHFF